VWQREKGDEEAQIDTEGMGRSRRRLCEGPRSIAGERGRGFDSRPLDHKKAPLQIFHPRTFDLQVLLVLGLIVGIITAAFAAGVPTLATHIFTPDTALWPIMRSVGPQAFWATLFCSVDVTASGALIATKQLSFLVKAMFGTLAVVAVYYAIGLRQPGWGLGGVWWGLALFFAMRAVQSTTRLVQTRLTGPLAPAG
jgi:hypothetical protein